MFVFRPYNGLSRPVFASAPPVWVVCFSLALVGCGGGGGGGGGEPDTTSPTAPTLDSDTDAPPFEVPENWQRDPNIWADNQEYASQPGLATVKAEEAYALGLTGRGQVIGFVDTGLYDTHPEFERKNIALNDRSGVSNPDNVQLSHGTGVASIALGARGSGLGLHGVAFDADPAAWTLNLDRDGKLRVNDRILSNAIQAIEGTGARIINRSWGYATSFDPAIAGAQRRYISQTFSETLDLISRGNAIHVWAADTASRMAPAMPRLMCPVRWP